MHTSTALLRSLLANVVPNGITSSQNVRPTSEQKHKRTIGRSLTHLVPLVWHRSVIHNRRDCKYCKPEQFWGRAVRASRNSQEFRDASFVGSSRQNRPWAGPRSLIEIGTSANR